MSQYGSMPPPGAYVPPNQGTPTQQQQQQQQPGYSQPQSPTYQPSQSKYGNAGHSHKAGGTFGMMMNQAVTTGKPMLDKLGKTISSKLGGKPAAGTPQHLQSYQNYQSHHGQQNQPQNYPPQANQPFTPQPQQQQQHWSQPQQAPNAYALSQQSPYQQTNYATPNSNPVGPSNYFLQQPSQATSSQPQTPQPPTLVSGYNAPQYGQAGNALGQNPQTQQGQYGQGQWTQSTSPAPSQQEQRLPGAYTAQQTGIVGSAQTPSQPQRVNSPQIPNVSPIISTQSPQSQWVPPLSSTDQLPPTAAQQPQPSSTGPNQPYQTIPSPPIPQDQSQQQWNSNAQRPGSTPYPTNSVSPSPQQANVLQQIPPSKPAQANHPSPPASQHAGPPSAPPEFIAELPADMGNLSVMEAKPPTVAPSAQSPQYQAYSPSGAQAGSPPPGFVIPRRSVSASSFPLADPWRFADPLTEVPTREFYILADLLFDALDRKFEPNCTGLLEAPKILATWVKLSEDARQLFSYKSYSALAKLWTLEGVPHIMVPCQPMLMPTWNFNQHIHAHDVKVITQPPTHASTYATYMPALNRAGWYKFFFLETVHAPDDIGEILASFCSDTYKPGVLNHPDLNKRNRAENTGLQARAGEIQTYAIARVCEETKLDMAADPNVEMEYNHPSLRAPGA